eukprot:scaffold553524_cov29-Prasinocladus_malaysianus.AAC.1
MAKLVRGLLQEPSDQPKLLGMLVESNAMELILKSLEDFVAAHKGDPCSSPESDSSKTEFETGRVFFLEPFPRIVKGGMSCVLMFLLGCGSAGRISTRLQGITERTKTLLFLFKITNAAIPPETTERLWACLVADVSHAKVSP